MEHDLYFISMAARLLEMHPQTLRKYERLGLVRPTRTVGSMRVYTHDELDRLRLIKHLVEEAGVNLAGVQRLLEIAEAVQRLRPLVKAALVVHQLRVRDLLNSYDGLRHPRQPVRNDDFLAPPRLADSSCTSHYSQISYE